MKCFYKGEIVGNPWLVKIAFLRGASRPNQGGKTQNKGEEVTSLKIRKSLKMRNCS